jgi:hypothetical protein
MEMDNGRGNHNRAVNLVFAAIFLAFCTQKGIISGALAELARFGQGRAVESIGVLSLL